MPQPFRFPRNPGTDRPNPFVDEQGDNPFADETPAAERSAEGTSASDPAAEKVQGAEAGDQALNAVSSDASRDRSDVFTTPRAESASGGQPAYRPSGYEMTLPHRGRTILTLGIVGLAGSMLGALGGLAALLAGYGYETTVFMSGLAPLSFLSLAASVPCCILAHYDLGAIRAGAMDREGESKTRLGFYLAVTAALISLGLIVWVLVAIVWSVVEAIQSL